MKLNSANSFTLDQLTHAYNQTRVDYLVPMPMNVARLGEYIRVYDVDLACSCVVTEDEEMLGLAMLGVREGRGWITRLGVLPSGRRRGTGSALMDSLISQSIARGLSTVWLEVIKGNAPAHHLFRKFGFVETRELIIARRPPKPDVSYHLEDKIKKVNVLNHDEALRLLAKRQKQPNWLNQTESLSNTRNLSALDVYFKDGSRGWVVYHASLLQLTRILLEVEAGDEHVVTTAVLQVLHQRHKRQDAKTENLFDDEQWQGFQGAGYFDSFRRIEMRLDL